MIEYIYTITDPRNNTVFYVGRTKNPKQRFYSHSSGGYSSASVIIRDLIKNKLKPMFTIIEEVCSEKSKERERYWIFYFFENGSPILNKEVNRKNRPLPYDIKISEGVSFDIKTLTN